MTTTTPISDRVSEWRLLLGDVRETLATVPAASMQTCVTSPPYWGLRDYGHAGQLGLEATPDAYVANLVAVFREVRRVLKDDGTLWLNLGDSYCASGGNTGGASSDGFVGRGWSGSNSKTGIGLKTKDLVGIPWMVAFALRADGWYLRSDIIWAKPNPMPESVTDRPTKSHEYLFLLTKGQWSTRTIQFSNLSDEPVKGCHDLSPNSPDAWGHQLSVSLASSILQSPEVQGYLRLSFLDSQIRQEGSERESGGLVAELPQEHRLLCEWAARLLRSDISAKAFLQQINRMGLDLRDRNALVVAGCSSKLTLTPPLYAKGDATVAVNYSGQICEFDLRRHDCIVSRPVGCSYYYNAAAIAEPVSASTVGRWGTDRPKRKTAAVDLVSSKAAQSVRGESCLGVSEAGRNKRSVWTVATQPFTGAHFAVFPEALIEPCILAGSRVGDTVLDPFTGSGTTGAVAVRHQRSFVGCELNAAYLELARTRIDSVAPLFAQEVAS